MKISLIKGDITELCADAIVNAASPTLMGGGGVDGDIHRKAGPKLKDECFQVRKMLYPGGVPAGKAVATAAYNLKAKIIIHTVGPVYKKEEVGLLQRCYLECLKIAERDKCRTIAFPAISTGAYGMPMEVSARLVKQLLDTYTGENIDEVILVLYDEAAYQIYMQLFQKTVG